MIKNLIKRGISHTTSIHLKSRVEYTRMDYDVMSTWTCTFKMIKKVIKKENLHYSNMLLFCLEDYFSRGANVKVERQQLTRLGKDLVTTHRIQSGKVDLKFGEFFRVHDTNTRGAQNNNIKVQKVKKDLRKHSFAIRSAK